MRSGIFVVFFASALFAQSYTIQQSNTVENLRGLSATSNNVVWASGTHGTYLRSTDGGKTWHAAQVPGAEAFDFRDVEAFNADLAYLLSAGPGEQSRIYKTTDGGASWTLQFTNKEPRRFFDCMAFWDRDHGVAVGDPVDGKFELIATEDGGGNWKAIGPDRLPPAKEGEGAFAASGSCITVQGQSIVCFATGGKAARVFHSSDAGKSWTVVETPIVHGADSAGIFSITFRDGKHGVIAGGDYKQPEKSGANLAFTDDGGLTWKTAAVSPQWYFSAVAFFAKHGAAHVPAHAENPNCAIFALGSAHAACANAIAARWQKTWNLNLNAVSVSPSGEIFAVGPKGLVVRFWPDQRD
jgi:photosystem II stability/assembly factor-like uncharacterized protein